MAKLRLTIFKNINITETERERSYNMSDIERRSSQMGNLYQQDMLHILDALCHKELIEERFS